MTLPPSEFDFDLMARLAREAPAEFARRRAELIQGAIARCQCPEEGYRLQGEIDAERLKTAPGQDTYGAMADRLSALVTRMSALAAEAGSAE